MLHARSSKQKLNTKSSTESEFVGVSDYLSYAIWLLYFLEDQGYNVSKKVLHQDNQSTIKLLKNGKKLAGTRSRHIETRFFWSTDRLKNHNIKVIHCPTSLMLADFFIRPLQGTLFKYMHNVAQGIEEYSILRSLYGRGTLSDDEEHEVMDYNDGSTASACVDGRKERVEFAKVIHEEKDRNKNRDDRKTRFECTYAEAVQKGI